MKTTIELADPTFRQAKVLAASRGMTLKQFFTEALEEKLRRCAVKPLIEKKRLHGWQGSAHCLTSRTKIAVS